MGRFCSLREGSLNSTETAGHQAQQIRKCIVERAWGPRKCLVIAGSPPIIGLGKVGKHNVQNRSSTITKVGRWGRSNRLLKLFRLLSTVVAGFALFVGVGLSAEVSLGGLQDGPNRFVGFVLQPPINVIIYVFRINFIFILFLFGPLCIPDAWRTTIAAVRLFRS